ncbi:MAG: hypothetical protein HY403_08985 [Elusimicrobia bacterium]|nr:hypothetical protein [Elusimicrobiota bacterium]
MRTLLTTYALTSLLSLAVASTDDGATRGQNISGQANLLKTASALCPERRGVEHLLYRLQHCTIENGFFIVHRTIEGDLGGLEVILADTTDRPTALGRLAAAFGSRTHVSAYTLDEYLRSRAASGKSMGMLASAFGLGEDQLANERKELAALLRLHPIVVYQYRATGGGEQPRR